VFRKKTKKARSGQIVGPNLAFSFLHKTPPGKAHRPRVGSCTDVTKRRPEDQIAKEADSITPTNPANLTSLVK
jgi:hypothetical protein